MPHFAREIQTNDVTTTIWPREREKRFTFRVGFSRLCVDSDANFCSRAIVAGILSLAFAFLCFALNHFKLNFVKLI